MRSMESVGDIKRQNQRKVMRYVIERGQTSRQEIAAALHFSMPTVIQYVAELLEWGLLHEAGEYGSTGGRKAKILKVSESFCYVAGVEIRKNSVRMVLLDLGLKAVNQEVCPLAYSDTVEYYTAFGECVREFIEKSRSSLPQPCHVIGVGLSVPGILHQGDGILQQSHILRASGVELKKFTANLPYETCVENDANNSAYAEVAGALRNVVYLSLNDTVGGAIYLNGELYKGENSKSAEVGHMVIVPNGRTCYCGKKGCLDAYCSARRLRGENYPTLEDFFASLEKREPSSVELWEDYLEHLALACGNLRVLFDCQIVLGGDVGGFLQSDLPAFEEKVRRYCNFDTTMSFLHMGGYKRESSAIGAARQMLNRYLENADLPELRQV